MQAVQAVSDGLLRIKYEPTRRLFLANQELAHSLQRHAQPAKKNWGEKERTGSKGIARSCIQDKAELGAEDAGIYGQKNF